MCYEEEEEQRVSLQVMHSVPVERVVTRDVSVPCYSLPLYTGVIRSISCVRVEINFGDTYAHRYSWYAVAIPPKEGFQVSLLRGDLRPRVSLNGAHACSYERDVTDVVRWGSCLCCLCWLHPSCFCCFRDSYATRSGEYEML